MPQNNPYIQKTEIGFVLTEEGKQYLAEIVTNPSGNVYAFTQKAPPMLIAAAMARLSRNINDMRDIYLDEFAAEDPSKAAALFRRVITAYGDDSVQQLAFTHLVVENASNILTKRLEWGRLAAYLEQSTRYIYFDQKNKNGRYRYFTPVHFPAGLKVRYEQTMDKIFDAYADLVKNLTNFVRSNTSEPTDKNEKIAWQAATRAQACDAARPMLPAATTSTVGIVASAQAIESLILHLASDTLHESRAVSREILSECRKVMPAFLERADLPQRGGAWIMHRADTQKRMRELAAELLPVSDGMKSSDDVELLDYWPKDELSLCAEILFAESDEVPLSEIQKRVAMWPKEKKEAVISAYMGHRMNRRHKPGRALEKAHYQWQITADYGTFRDLQRHRMVDGFEWQRLTTAYGYEIPEIVEKAGLAAEFERAFDLSDKLYSELRSQGFSEEAQYATLLGHRMRYTFLLNARASFHFHELRTTPQGHPGYRKIVKKMHDILSSVHPNIGRAMIFVNKDEDPELTRLSAELATQRKLELLEK